MLGPVRLHSETNPANCNNMKIIFLLAAISLAASVPRVLGPELGLQFKNLFKPVVSVQKVLKPRIIGGSEAVPHSRPFQAFLEVLDDWGLLIGYCGGQILSKNYILTAAHCIGLGTLNTFVTLGAHEVFKFNEPGKISVTAHNFTVHPDYDQNELINDIAVFKLDEPIEFSDHIQPVTLPSKADAASTFVGETATLSGWGYIESGHWSDPSTVLNVLDSPIVPNSQCEEESGWEIPDTQICISGADQTGGCTGDSGGPLTVKISGVDTIVGIASYTGMLCLPGTPTVSTRVTSYLDWIAANTDAVVN